MRSDERGEGGEDVVLLAGGEGEEEEWDGCPESEEQEGGFCAVRVRMETSGWRDLRKWDAGDGVEEVGADQGMSQMRRSPQKR